MEVFLTAEEQQIIIQVSDSQSGNFIRCPRRWGYEKLLHLSPQEDAKNMTYGKGFHKATEMVSMGYGYKEALDAGIAEMATDMKKNGQKLPLLYDWLPAHLWGFMTHFLPNFHKVWQTTGVEEKFELMIHPNVKVIGYIDNRSVAVANPQLTALHDYKTTSMTGGGTLGDYVHMNKQLSLYAISNYLLYGFWPSYLSLVFVQKPRTKDMKKWTEQAKTDPALYFMKGFDFTPMHAEYAIQVRDNLILWALQMLRHRNDFEKNGMAAIDRLPANFDGCEKYYSMCGFADGCHSGNPAHLHLQGPVK